MIAMVGTDCPSWCEHHLNDDYPADEFEGIVHQRRVEVGDAFVTIQETTGQSDVSAAHADPEGPIITEIDFQWISEETIRNYAEALNLAADLIGIPRP